MIVWIEPVLVDDLDGEREVRNAAELEHVLMKRNGSGMNHFALGRGRARYPSLIMMVNRDLAWLYFMKNIEHVGCYAVGSIPGLDPKEMTEFVSPGPQEEAFFNNQVVPFSDALRAAQEFAVSGQLPQCIEWREP